MGADKIDIPDLYTRLGGIEKQCTITSAQITQLFHKTKETHDLVTAISAGGCPVGKANAERITALEKAAKTNGNGNGKENGNGNGGMTMEFLRGLISFKNISSNKAVAIAKLGRDLGFAVILLWLLLRGTGVPSFIGDTDNPEAKTAEVTR